MDWAMGSSNATCEEADERSRVGTDARNASVRRRENRSAGVLRTVANVAARTDPLIPKHELTPRLDGEMAAAPA